MVRRIEDEIGDAQHRGARRGHPARERTQTRNQDLERERFRQVVVGAAIEARDDVRGRITCREHENRYGAAALTEPARDLTAVELGQHPIENHEVVVDGPRQIESFLAIVSDERRVTLALEAAAQLLRHLRLVLDDQYSHVRRFNLRSARYYTFVRPCGAMGDPV